MKKGSIVACIFCLLSVFYNGAAAQVEEGNQELSVMFSYNNISIEGQSESIGMILLGGSYGYFFNDELQVGGSMFYAGMLSGNKVPGMGMISPTITYHFMLMNPMLVPYVGTSVSKYFFTDWDGEKPSIFGFGINGGLKYFLSEDTSLGPQLRWDRQTYKIGGDSLSANQIQFLVVLSTFF